MKTIGRAKPKPDRTLVDESIAAHETVSAGVIETPTARERALIGENLLLKREVTAANERANAYAMGCDPRNPTRPVLTAFEREREFERLLMSFADMTPEARERAVTKLIDDTKSYVERRDKWHDEVARNMRRG